VAIHSLFSNLNEGQLKMALQDWLLTNEGKQVEQAVNLEESFPDSPYRLYHFLSDLDDILDRVRDDYHRLQKICPLVRRLLNSSEWLQTHFLPPDPDTGWSVQMLYDEPDYPITVQTVVWLPGSVSPIHNHGAWGIVALLSGTEKNTFWSRNSTPTASDRIKQVGEQILFPGDILGFMPDAIHRVEALGDEPTVSFNLYGETDYSQRFEFDSDLNTAQTF
jgi:predicted metal-dependent enzyme (double-stranded beta helix superfamily)